MRERVYRPDAALLSVRRMFRQLGHDSERPEKYVAVIECWPTARDSEAITSTYWMCRANERCYWKRCGDHEDRSVRLVRERVRGHGEEAGRSETGALQHIGEFAEAERLGAEDCECEVSWDARWEGGGDIVSS